MAIEKTLSVTSARSQLLKLTKLAARHMTRFVLTNKGEAEAVLLSVSEYKSLRAAAELATRPEVLSATLRGFEEIERGEGLTIKQAFASQEKTPGAPTASAGE
jgi:PHD/YefM family antitoxin component YafN of YafNO toxin-antitoxin module